MTLRFVGSVRGTCCATPCWGGAVGCRSRRVIHYFEVARDAAENRILREENLTLRTQLKTVRERIEHIGSTLDRVERFDQKLRALTLLSDPQRNLAHGARRRGSPGSAHPGRRPSSPAPSAARPRATSPSKLDKLSD